MKFVSSFLFLAALASAAPGLVNVDHNDINVLNLGNNRPSYVNNNGGYRVVDNDRDHRPDYKPDYKNDHKPGNKYDNKPGYKNDHDRDYRPDYKPGNKYDN
ncbi:hypothetical protein GGH94_005285, partial [Coemansia aciculifera]